MRVLILCPIGVKTGGPQALHQLCHELISLGVDAYLVPADSEKTKPEPSFAKYKAPILFGLDFKTEDFLIVPETLVVLPSQFKNIANCRTFIWWLSIDNSSLPWVNNYELRMNRVKAEWGTKGRIPHTAIRRMYDLLFEIKFGVLASYSKSKCHRINPRKVNNLCQSEYAMQILSKRGFNGLEYLSDYVEVDQEAHLSTENVGARQIRVAYNFAKSKEQVEILKSVDDSLDFIPLSGLSRKEMAEQLKRAELFLDLGHFPGKDRLPREAILLGCPVLLAKRGAARYAKDFPLENEFLVDLEVETPADAVSKIHRIARDKKSAFAQQNNFLSEVLQQKATFSDEVRALKINLEMIAGGVA